MILLDQTVVSVALPTMSRDLPLSSSGAQWVVNAYVLAMAAFVALGGKLGSKLGPVTTYRVGVVVFFLASAVCGLAPVGSHGEDWLITARVVQGVGAALMMPVTAAIVMAAFPESVRGRAMGAYVGIGQIFLALGPLVGGACTEWLSWRVVFWLNVPVGLVALVLVHVARPANDREPALRVATQGAQRGIQFLQRREDELHPPVPAGQAVQNLPVQHEGAVHLLALRQRPVQGGVVRGAQVAAEPDKAAGVRRLGRSARPGRGRHVHR